MPGKRVPLPAPGSTRLTRGVSEAGVLFWIVGGSWLAIMIGLVAAGGLAAALSTAAGLLLAISSAVSHDLLKGQLTPNMSEKSELLAARISMAAAIVVAVILGINPPGFAAQTVALAFGLAAASIFPALMMGIFDKRANSSGAVAAWAPIERASGTAATGGSRPPRPEHGDLPGRRHGLPGRF